VLDIVGQSKKEKRTYRPYLQRVQNLVEDMKIKNQSAVKPKCSMVEPRKDTIFILSVVLTLCHLISLCGNH
jgi:hypothetical protein